jgi:hypothetical protein
MNARFAIAITAYAVLAIVGGILFTGKIRAALWIFLAALAVKTLIVVGSRRGE